MRQAYEQWDGKGVPDHLSHDRIGLPARLVQLAGPVEVFSRRHGFDATLDMARRNSGPSSTRRSSSCSALPAPTCWTESTGPRTGMPCWIWNLSPARQVDGPELDAVLEAMADLVDLKSPHLAGHSPGVANLAAEAARLAGMSTTSRRCCAGPV